MAENAITIVAQFNHAKLPVSTSHAWVRITVAPADAPMIAGTGPGTNMPRMGANRKNGTTSWAK